MAMCTARRLGLTLGAVVLCVAASGRTLMSTTPQRSEETPVVKSSDRFSLELVVPKKQMTLGEQLWVALIVTNNGQTDIPFPDTQVDVEGVHGEPPMTIYQRQMGHKRNPGEGELRRQGFNTFIRPSVYDVRRFDLSKFYFLTEPGKYTVYVDVWDEKKAVWVRSPTAEFDLLPPAAPHR